MADGGFTVDSAGHFASLTSGAERITGLSRDEVVGQPCSALEGPDCRGFGNIAHLLANPVGRDGIQDERRRIFGKHGRPLRLLGNLRLLRGSDARVQGTIGTFTDLTVWIVQQAPAPHAGDADARRLAGLVGRSKRKLDVLRRIEFAAQSDVSALERGAWIRASSARTSTTACVCSRS